MQDTFHLCSRDALGLCSRQAIARCPTIGYLVYKGILHTMSGLDNDYEGEQNNEQLDCVICEGALIHNLTAN